MRKYDIIDIIVIIDIIDIYQCSGLVRRVLFPCGAVLITPEVSVLAKTVKYCRLYGIKFQKLTN